VGLIRVASALIAAFLYDARMAQDKKREKGDLQKEGIDRSCGDIYIVVGVLESLRLYTYTYTYPIDYGRRANDGYVCNVGRTSIRPRAR
jgi:hypothetical protein